MKFGELWWVDYPFEDVNGSKVRPALVIITKNDDEEIGCTKVTGTLERKRGNDFIIKEWQKANLKKESLVELRKRKLIHKDKFKTKIGNLDRSDLLQLIRGLESIKGNNGGELL